MKIHAHIGPEVTISFQEIDTICQELLFIIFHHINLNHICNILEVERWSPFKGVRNSQYLED